MRYSSALLLSTVCAASLGGQTIGSLATNNIARWSVAVAYGAMPLVHGDAKRLWKTGPEQMSLAVRRRLGDTRLWLGGETGVWFVSANAAGVDSLAARGGPAVQYKENGARFGSAAFVLSARYDIASKGPVVGYGIANVGANKSGGFVAGLCSYYECVYPPVNVRGPTGIAGSAGLGVQAHYFNFDGWARLVPSRIYAELRVANETSADGRITMVPIQVGMSW